MGFCSVWAYKCACKIWNPYIALPVPEITARGYPKKIGQPLDTPTLPFLKKFKGPLFGWNLWMYWPNLKFVAFPVPEIIGSTQKKIEQSLDTPTIPFLQIFYGLLFGWSLWMYWQNLKSVAFPVPEIIGAPKNLGSLRIRTRFLFPKIFMGFYSDGPSECTG